MRLYKKDFMIMEQLNIKIYKDIFERILQGDLPADSLIRENSLIEYYGVSRAPVREALIMLCTEGVLKSIPRAGYQIIQVSEKQEREIIQFRCFLECSALKANWGYIHEQFIEKLQAADAKQCSTAPSFLSAFWQANIDFHTLLISLGNNNYAVESLRSAMRTQYRALGQYLWNFQGNTNPLCDPGHKMLLNALAQKDLSLSVARLEEDIMGFRIYDKFI